MFLSGVFSLTSSAAQKEAPGYLRADLFFDVYGLNVVPSVTKDPRYPNSPTEITFLKFFEYPPGAEDGTLPPANVYKNHGARIWGLLTPKETDHSIYSLLLQAVRANSG